MARLRLSSTAALIAVLAVVAFDRRTAALTEAEAIDSANAFPNVGTIMVWRDANNPLGLPGGLAASVTGVLIHSQTIRRSPVLPETLHPAELPVRRHRRPA